MFKAIHIIITWIFIMMIAACLGWWNKKIILVYNLFLYASIVRKVIIMLKQIKDYYKTKGYLDTKQDIKFINYLLEQNYTLKKVRDVYYVIELER